VRHVFVDEHTLDQRGVGEGAPDFSVHLDQIERYIASLEICYRQDRIDGYLSELSVLFRDAMGALKSMPQSVGR
jgi:hypothetical protein